ncbi:MAG: MBL fold metallo-hydrolase [Gammaproteobacteria bacterium]|nr:MBL fold metallo-hydrolase [Gammaproteobacteria bacterium]
MLQRLILVVFGSVIFLGGCEKERHENPYHIEFSAPDYLTEHARYLSEELFQIGDHPVWDYNTPNRGFGNIIMIEGDDGIIIIDTSSAPDHARVANQAFREITDKPVRAIVYTHHHADHIRGADVFTNRADVANGRVKIIAAENFLRELSDENQATAPIMGMRAMYMYGQLLDPQAEGRDYHISCCGYQLSGGGSGYIEPNHFITDSEDIIIAGVTLQIFQTGGESASHLAVYLPEQKILFTGDEIQGPSYPNLHSLRGTKPRDAQKWMDALDRMRDFDVDYLVPSHGQPVFGKAASEKLLTLYHDVIQFTHDQSIRYINKGYTPDELANTIRLPDFMDADPWTREMYGTVKHNVREYYVAYISWWNGDPAELDPLPRAEQARRFIRLMGGRDAVFAEAEKAFSDRDYQWASELTTLLIRVDKEDMPARNLKAGALRAIGYATANTNWRGFYLSSALELEGKINPQQVLQKLKKSSFRPEQLSSSQLFNVLRFYLDAEAVDDDRLKIAYDIRDTGEKFTLEIRNSILDIHRSILPDVDATLSLERATLDNLFSERISYADGIQNGEISITGSKLALLSFAGAFDMSPPNPFLTLR